MLVHLQDKTDIFISGFIRVHLRLSRVQFFFSRRQDPPRQQMHSAFLSGCFGLLLLPLQVLLFLVVLDLLNKQSVFKRIRYIPHFSPDILGYFFSPSRRQNTTCPYCPSTKLSIYKKNITRFYTGQTGAFRVSLWLSRPAFFLSRSPKAAPQGVGKRGYCLGGGLIKRFYNQDYQIFERHFFLLPSFFSAQY